MIDRTLKHYRIIAALGAGGMGEVYLAQDMKLDRKVALKMCRFIREHIGDAKISAVDPPARRARRIAFCRA